MDSPFQIDVYDRAMQWQGRLADPISIDGSVRTNALGNFQIRVASNDVMADDLLTPGCRLVMSYLPVTERRAQGGPSYTYPPLMSGMIRTEQGSVLPGGDLIVQLQDDWRILPNTVAWVNPGNPLAPTSLEATINASWGQAWLPGGGSDAGPNGTTQGQFGYYLWPDGSAASGGLLIEYAEDAIKHIIEVNAINRLGRPMTVATPLGRGGNAAAAGVLPQLRMAKLSEAVESLLEWSGLTLKLIQLPGTSTIQIEVYEPSAWSAPLTVESGIVQDGTWSRSAPSVTRSIVGGPGENVDRAFWGVNDETGLEDLYGDVIEVFRDATGAKTTWPTSVTELYRVAKYFLLRGEPSPLDQLAFQIYLQSAGSKGLLEGLPTASAQVKLSETESFYFGGAEGIQLGDWATIRTSAGDLYTQRVSEAKFSFTRDGLTVEPIIGAALDDPNQMIADAIAKLAAAQRRVSTSR